MNSSFYFIVLFLPTAAIFAQIDYSVLDKWKCSGCQIPNMTRPEPNAPKEEKTTQPELTEKEIRRINEQAEKKLAQIRKSLITAEKLRNAVSWNTNRVQIAEGLRYFNLPPNQGGVFASIANTTRKTPVSSMTPLAMRRSAAILARAQLPGVSPEDASFLSAQASIALQGGALQVFVDDNTLGISDAQEKKFRILLEETEKSNQNIELTKKEEEQIFEQQEKINDEVTDKTMDEAKLKLKKLAQQLLDLMERRKKEEEALKDLSKKVERIIKFHEDM